MGFQTFDIMVIVIFVQASVAMRIISVNDVINYVLLLCLLPRSLLSPCAPLLCVM